MIFVRRLDRIEKILDDIRNELARVLRAFVAPGIYAPLASLSQIRRISRRNRCAWSA
jgi:hypothetical protein